MHSLTSSIHTSNSFKLILLFTTCISLQACFSETVCDCFPSGFDLSISTSATALRLSGDACDDAKVTCSNLRSPSRETNLCSGSNHHIDPSGSGTCHVEVDLSGMDGGTTFVKDIEIYYSTGCCGGLRVRGGDSIVEVR